MTVQCNREREDIGSSNKFKGIEEINEKKFTYAKVIHVDEVDKDNCNWDTLWGIANTLLSNIVEENNFKKHRKYYIDIIPYKLIRKILNNE